MGSVRRHGRLGIALTLALMLAGCGPLVDPGSATLRVGYDTLDGSLRVWPPRGSLAGDAAATAAITKAVRAWRSPVDDGVHLQSSGILWSGELDGTPLALVAADVPGESASWLLQLTRDGDRYVVRHATEYTDPGYLVYSDVLPVQVPTGRRYLTSARVERLLGPDGDELAITDGLTGPVAVPACSAVALTARLRATESLPSGRPAGRLLDLGTGVQDPRYPLVGDDSGSGRKALEGLDTCALAGSEVAFGSVPRRIGDREEAASAPDSWPIDAISVKSLGELPLGDGEPADLQQLTWNAQAGSMTAVIYRPAGGGAPVVSAADRTNDLHAYVLPVPERPLAVLTWRPDPDSALSVPPNTPRLVDRPGLAVVPAPARKATFSLAQGDEVHYRAVGGR